MGLFFVVRCYEKRRRACISLLLITAVLKVLGAFQGKALEAAGQRADNAPLEVHADSFGLHWGKAWHATKTTQKKRKEPNADTQNPNTIAVVAQTKPPDLSPSTLSGDPLDLDKGLKLDPGMSISVVFSWAEGGQLCPRVSGLRCARM